MNNKRFRVNLAGDQQKIVKGKKFQNIVSDGCEKEERTTIIILILLN